MNRGRHEAKTAAGPQMAFQRLGWDWVAFETVKEEISRHHKGDRTASFFDLCAAHQKVYGPFGKAIRNHRSQVFFQLHFGAVYNKKGDYGWSRDLSRIQETFAWEMEQLQTDYVDLGFLHCVDEDGDVDALIANGIID
ncbi:MAG: hypothetical protein ACLVJ6_08080, partial [Merdibacter sp.]